ncbi:chain length determinant protein tyrosine kinase EpsG [Herminiimonas arsenitoxidans]|uniref:chain length determinant protein tyrosine kinase EpsG n=1 Tax=Herminiimonas arsenitoxidans TaxID=1809410 RepID=UPI0009FB5CE8|nr:chain length determinant protein tyrosine kinase EpsG [Herminiimonas arsenitoxidans]
MIRTATQIQDAATLQFREEPSITHSQIGSILEKSGRLSVDGTERILQEQRVRRQRFGDAGIALGLLTEADIEFALSSQFAYPYLLKGQSTVSEELIAAYDPFSKQVEALRALRSQLVMRWFGTGAQRSALAITSAEQGDGRSYIAANLAILFSQLGQRTLLIDADMRNPRQHQLFGIENRSGLSAILSGRKGVADVQRIPSLMDLSVLPTGVLPPNPQELLGRAAFPQLLRDFGNEFDVVLIDTPPDYDYADGQMAAARAGAALVVARKDISHTGAIGNLVDSMKQSGVLVVGAVLNEY